MLYGVAEYVNGSTHLGSLIRYSCSHNYRLVGPHVRDCQENHQWSEGSPKCEGKTTSYEHTKIHTDIVPYSIIFNPNAQFLINYK